MSWHLHEIFCLNNDDWIYEMYVVICKSICYDVSVIENDLCCFTELLLLVVHLSKIRFSISAFSHLSVI